MKQDKREDKHPLGAEKREEETLCGANKCKKCKRKEEVDWKRVSEAYYMLGSLLLDREYRKNKELN